MSSYLSVCFFVGLPRRRCSSRHQGCPTCFLPPWKTPPWNWC